MHDALTHDAPPLQSSLLFRANNPDGGRYQNCLRLDSKGLEDTECKKSSCSACAVPSFSTWTLRGICEEDEVRFASFFPPLKYSPMILYSSSLPSFISFLILSSSLLLLSEVSGCTL